MEENPAKQTLQRLFWSAAALLAILIGGTFGYWFLTRQSHSLMDCLFMTFITISTIGFEEVIDVSGNDFGKVFTMLVALSGIGVLTFALSTLTAFIIEGDINLSFKKRAMENKIKDLNGHYIVCGAGRVGEHIIDELTATGWPLVLVDLDAAADSRAAARRPGLLYVTGDASDNEVLQKAGIERAAGLFAVTRDDNLNLVVCLTAKQINPRARIVSHCHNLKNFEKMERAGADELVSSEHIGGLRMSSVMIRPTVVSFLDLMLRDKEKNLRLEEIPLPGRMAGKTIADLNLKNFRDSLLLAVKQGDKLVYNPPENGRIELPCALIVMTTPPERKILEESLKEG